MRAINGVSGVRCQFRQKTNEPRDRWTRSFQHGKAATICDLCDVYLDTAQSPTWQAVRDAAAEDKTKATIKTGKHGMARVTGGRGTSTRTVVLLTTIVSVWLTLVTG